MKKVAIVIFVLLFIGLALAMGKYFYDQMKKDPVVYETEKASIGNIVQKTVATGSIVPRREVEVKAQVTGVIEEIFVEAGQLVTKGQLLARIQVVPDENSLQAARAQVDLARIDYQAAEKERQRQERLFKEGTIAEQAYLQFALTADLTFQQLKGAEAALDVLQTGAARGSKTAANLVRSTADGMILDVPVREGSPAIASNNFNEGTTIVTVADMGDMIFEGKVDESEVGKLKEGMTLQLTVGAIEDLVFDATLKFISPKGVTEEGTIKFSIRADVDPTQSAFLRAGYSANADILLDRRDSVLLIKESLLQFKGDTAYVEIEKANQVFERRNIALGLSDGLSVEVLSGLDTTLAIKVPVLE